MKWAQIRGKSGGMNFPKALTELIDNDIDSQLSLTHSVKHTYIKSFTNALTQKAYLLLFSNSQGLADIAHLYGLGETIVKKGEGSIGDKNHGHSAAVAFLSPDSIYSETCVAAGTTHSLMFRVGAFNAHVDTMADSSTADYRKIDVKEYMTVFSGRDEAQLETLLYAAKTLRTPELKADFDEILSQTKSNYMFHILEFGSSHAHMNTLLDGELIDFFPSLSLHYSSILKGGYTILFEPNAKTVPHKKADSASALSPFVSVEQYPTITFLCNIYQVDKETYLQVTVNCGGHERDFYITDTPFQNKRLKKSEVVQEPNPAWAMLEQTLVGSFTFEYNCISEEAYKKYSTALGSDLRGVDNTRGVYTNIYGRTLGKPYWSKTWGAVRNSGYIGASLSINSKKVANTYFGLQSNKHNSELADSHTVVQAFLDLSMKCLIKNYSDYKKKGTSKSGVKVWNTEKYFKQLLGSKDEEPAVDEPNSATNSVVNSVSDSEEQLQHLPPPVTMLHSSSGLTPSAPVDVLTSNPTPNPTLSVDHLPELLMPPSTRIPKPVERKGLTFEAASSGKLIAMDDVIVLAEIPGLGQSANLQKYFETMNREFGPDITKSIFTSIATGLIDV